MGSRCSLLLTCLLLFFVVHAAADLFVGYTTDTAEVVSYSNKDAKQDDTAAEDDVVVLGDYYSASPGKTKSMKGMLPKKGPSIDGDYYYFDDDEGDEGDDDGNDDEVVNDDQYYNDDTYDDDDEYLFDLFDDDGYYSKKKTKGMNPKGKQTTKAPSAKSVAPTLRPTPKNMRPSLSPEPTTATSSPSFMAPVVGPNTAQPTVGAPSTTTPPAASSSPISKATLSPTEQPPIIVIPTQQPSSAALSPPSVRPTIVVASSEEPTQIITSPSLSPVGTTAPPTVLPPQLSSFPTMSPTTIFPATADPTATPVCACSPERYDCIFNFGLTCADENITGTDGVEKVSCIIAGDDPNSLVPVIVTSMDFVEYNQEMQVSDQVSLVADFFQGFQFFYFSPIVNPGQVAPVDYPKIFQITANGLNEASQSVRMTWNISYSNSCGVYPTLLAGQQIGWISFTRLAAPDASICPAVDDVSNLASPASTASSSSSSPDKRTRDIVIASCAAVFLLGVVGLIGRQYYSTASNTGKTYGVVAEVTDESQGDGSSTDPYVSEQSSPNMALETSNQTLGSFSGPNMAAETSMKSVVFPNQQKKSQSPCVSEHSFLPNDYMETETSNRTMESFGPFLFPDQD